MKILNITYDTWKAVANEPDNAGWLKFFVVGKHGKSIYTGHEEVIFASTVRGDEELEFDSLYTSVEIESQDDACAKLIGLNIQPLKRDSLGHQVVSTTPYATSEKTELNRYVGLLYTCPAGTSEHLYSITSPVRLRGGTYWVDSASTGDRLSLTVMNGIQEVARYCDRLPLAPWSHMSEITSPTAATLSAGLQIKFTYENNGSSDVNLGISLNWFEIVPQ